MNKHSQNKPIWRYEFKGERRVAKTFVQKSQNLFSFAFQKFADVDNNFSSVLYSVVQKS